jgi:uncharacterized delta-60 repeat protein
MNATSHRGRKQRLKPRSLTTKPRLERLEDRLALSGFGPEDGSYVIEPRIGYYDAVQIEAADQKIVAAGQISSGTPTVERYDSQGNVDTSYGTGGLAAINIPSGYRDGTNGLGLTLQADGKAVVAGRVTNTTTVTSDVRVARLTASGVLDTTFGSAGQTVVSTYPATSP